MHRFDPMEIAAIVMPVLAQFAAVLLFIAAGFVWLIILATPVPA